MTTLVAVTADIRDIVDATVPVVGSAEFIAPSPVSLATGAVLGNRRSAVVAISGGAFSVPVHLAASDSGDEAPQGWSWLIKIDTNVWSGWFHALVTSSMAADGVSLGQLYRDSPDAGIVDPGTAYVSVADVGTTVAPLVAGKVPESYLPAVSSEDDVARAAVSAETTRATGQETTLASNLAAEVSRATTAEGTLSGLLSGKYSRPGGGIPESDLATALQTKIDAAGTAADLATEVTRATGAEAALTTSVGAKYTKPGTGVPKTDLATAVQASLSSADTALQVAPVTSVAGRVGDVVPTKADVGLGSVDNTTDAGKPVSTAMQTALNAKVATTRSVTAGTGLTGGGDLSADRSLAVSYGTAAGTAAQGNDSRITGALTQATADARYLGLAGGTLTGALEAGSGVTVGAVPLRPILFAFKAADQTTTSNAVAFNDSDLHVSVAASAVYRVQGWLLYDGSTTPDLDVKWTAPAGSTFRWATDNLGPGASSGVGAGLDVTGKTLASTATLGAVGVGTKVTAKITGLLTVGGTAGTFQMQWCQHTSDATVLTLSAGSHIELVRVA